MRVLVATGCNVHSNDTQCGILYDFYPYGLDALPQLNYLCYVAMFYDLRDAFHDIEGFERVFQYIDKMLRFAW